MTGHPYVEELDFVLAFVTDAARLVREFRSAGFRTDVKADRSFVTTADHEVNRVFIERVAARFPGDDVLGEELSHRDGGARTWVIDPIDGTEQFLLAVPTFMISVALTDAGGRPVVAALANPSTGEVYRAVRGHGAFRGEDRLRVSQRDGVTEPAVVRTSGAAPATGRGLAVDGIVRFSLPPDADRTARTARPDDTDTADTDTDAADADHAGGGAAAHPGGTPSVVPVRYPWPSAFSGCKVAEGVWDADLYNHDGAHDVAATALLVEEAGGRASDRDGAVQRYDRPINGCVLSNGRVHDAVLRHWRAGPTIIKPS